ncbi:DinB family protein [Bacillus massiliglaciei]|uniref:DinB family protein n=1 Tax=Bacillus massiliglaciei TaxID=1816693 RepID=UPI000DA62ED5|nr:DinB family protein [Bacillus massiliglaciei]
MNIYCKSALNQIKIAINSTAEIIDQLNEEDMEKRPSPDKHSIGELLEHIAMICKADLLIANGATQAEMNQFYSSVSYDHLHAIRDSLFENYQLLKETYMQCTETELQQTVTAYWGTAYSRYEWLLEIAAHIYHHRGQLHAILVHCYKKDPHVLLFD